MTDGEMETVGVEQNQVSMELMHTTELLRMDEISKVTAHTVDSGVAKDANLYSVRVLGISAYDGTWAIVITGLDYVGSMHQINSAR